MPNRALLSRKSVSLLAVTAALLAPVALALAPSPAVAQGPSPARYVGRPAGEFAGPGLLALLRQRRDLSTFTRLLELSGLASTISGNSQYTVFAPDDRAWAAVPADRMEFLTRQENRELLRQILRYHIVSSRLTSADLAGTEDGLLVQTLNPDNGLVVHSRLWPSYLAVNQAAILTPDIRVENDVVHVVDSVTVPSGQYALALYGDRVRLDTAGSAALPSQPAQPAAPPPAQNPASRP